MFTKKIIVASLLAMAMGSTAIWAEDAINDTTIGTQDLHIQNNTNQYSATYINNVTCSDGYPLGTDGVTKPYEKDHVTGGRTVWVLCSFGSTDCLADIYVEDNLVNNPIPGNNNCTSPPAIKIATVHFDASTGGVGFKSADPVPGAIYCLGKQDGQDGFHLKLDVCPPQR